MRKTRTKRGNCWGWGWGCNKNLVTLEQNALQKRKTINFKAKNCHAKVFKKIVSTFYSCCYP